MLELVKGQSREFPPRFPTGQAFFSHDKKVKEEERSFSIRGRQQQSSSSYGLTNANWAGLIEFPALGKADSPFSWKLLREGEHESRNGGRYFCSRLLVSFGKTIEFIYSVTPESSAGSFVFIQSEDARGPS